MNEELIREVIATIVNGYNPSKIILFGSHAKGNSGASSDLDLLIIKDTTIPRYKRAHQVRELFKVQPCAMDILVYTSSEYNHLLQFKSLIPFIATNEGKIVYERRN